MGGGRVGGGRVGGGRIRLRWIVRCVSLTNVDASEVC